MALTPGTRLGPYEIAAQIGAGGMGEVYKARDTKLDRDVAIKILPDAFAHDADRLARFQREAKTLASLNHPNIAGIYGLEESGGMTALVMELVEGDDLSQRIARGAIPLDEALPIAKQIAEALEAAHEQGIIHRDLKPANIKVRADGTVKVLDFGLAKAMDPVGVVSSSHSTSPTITTPAMTGVGMILGTAAYMSPEQAKGRAADKRSDVWAFGCVLYEMLTGASAFTGESITDTIASIITREPDWRGVPSGAERLLRCCLQKDPKRRLRDIGDVLLLLDEPLSEVKAPNRTPWLVTAATLLLAIAAVWVASRNGTPSIDHSVVSADIDLGADVDSSMTGSSMILSPDGSRLLVVSRGTDGVRRLFRRNLDESRGTPLPGTEGAYLPFFSPNGQWVAFFAGGKLKKTPVAGGEVTMVCDAPAGRGGTWSENDTIVVALDTRVGLSMVPASGGVPVSLTQLNAERRETGHRWPHFIPGGNAVVFTASDDPANFNSASIALVSLADGQVKILVERGGADGRYLPSGHLLYMNSGRAFAIPFDKDRLEVRGKATPVLEGIAYSASTGAGQFAFSQTGQAVYQRGVGLGQVRMQWLDGADRTAAVLAEPDDYRFPALSPDGNLLAVAATGDVWVHDWQRGTRYRITTGDTRNNMVPIWTPDGTMLVFRATGGIYWARADGAGQPRSLIQSKNFLSPLAIAPDGRTLAYSENAGVGVDIYMASLEIGSYELRIGKSALFLKAPSTNTLASFSADGRWFAYASAKSGIYEVYVRAFPDKGNEWTVSSGGHMPVWSRNGRELFYRTEDGLLMVVPYTVKNETFIAGRPRQWSKVRLAYSGLERNFDLAPDGERFVAGFPVEGRDLPNHVVLVVNFFDEVRRRLRAIG